MSEFDIRQRSAPPNPHAANPPVLSSMQRFWIPRRTILTIDFINFSRASVPGCPSLIFTTGTSIIVMACKNEELTSTWQPKADKFPRQEGLTTLSESRWELQTNVKQSPGESSAMLISCRENRLLKEAATSEVLSHHVKGKERRISGTSSSSPIHYIRWFHPESTYSSFIIYQALSLNVPSLTLQTQTVRANDINNLSSVNSQLSNVHQHRIRKKHCLQRYHTNYWHAYLNVACVLGSNGSSGHCMIQNKDLLISTTVSTQVF